MSTYTGLMWVRAFLQQIIEISPTEGKDLWISTVKARAAQELAMLDSNPMVVVPREFLERVLKDYKWSEMGVDDVQPFLRESLKTGVEND